MRRILTSVRSLGNTRVALAAMVTYLEMNRHAWKCGEVEETAMLLHAAAGKVKEPAWEAWVVGKVAEEEVGAVLM